MLHLCVHPERVPSRKSPLVDGETWTNLENSARCEVHMSTSHTRLTLLSKLVTLNDLEWHSGRYFALFR